LERSFLAIVGVANIMWSEGMTYDPSDPNRLSRSDPPVERTAAWIIGTLIVLMVAVAIVWAVDEHWMTASSDNPPTTTGQSTDSQKPGSAPQTDEKSKTQ
jgi:hypothetical protein